MNLHEPDEDFSKFRERTTEEASKDAYEKGGERVDRELRSLVEDIYTLGTEFNVDLE